MRRSTRRQRLEQSHRGWVAPPRPFGAVKIRALTARRLERADVSARGAARTDNLAELERGGGTKDRSMSMTAFFEYLHDHQATTDLAKALADVAMLRTSGARRVRPLSDHERMAS